MLYIDLVNKIMVDCKDTYWTEMELVKLRNEIADFKSVVQRHLGRTAFLVCLP